MRNGFGTDDRHQPSERTERHHSACAITHIKARKIRSRRAGVLVRMQRYPERVAEQIEVVHVERSEIDLQCVEHVGQAQSQQFRFCAVEVVIELRRRRAE